MFKEVGYTDEKKRERERDYMTSLISRIWKILQIKLFINTKQEKKKLTDMEKKIMDTKWERG